LVPNLIEKTERSDTTNLQSSIVNIQSRLVRVRHKLAASPQPVESLQVVRLECWNAGNMEKWVLAYGSERIRKCWVNGKIRLGTKLKMDNIL
jgi:hypothetical protein